MRRRGPRPSVSIQRGQVVALYVGGDALHYIMPALMLIVIPSPERLACPTMMSSLPLLMRERPIHCTLEKEELQRKITQSLTGSRENLICNYGFSIGRVDYPMVVRTRRSFPGGKVNGSVGFTFCYDLHSTGPINGAAHNLMNWPSTCSSHWVMMLPLCHMSDNWIVHCYFLCPISGIKALKVLKAAALSPGWRSSLFPCVFSQLILGGMANYEGSASSSPDPLVELDAEVKVLRRRVKRHGHFLQQLDEMGGRRLDQIEEDKGRLRSNLTTALRMLEEKVSVALDKLEFRLQKMEGTLAKQRDAGISSHTMGQTATKSTFGTLGKQPSGALRKQR